MINFKPITIEDKPLYEQYLLDGKERGCEYAFANLYLWGDQRAAILYDHMVIFSRFGDRMIYPYPVGKGDKKHVLDAIREDARERGVTLQLSGMCAEQRQGLEEFYPGDFIFHGCQGNDDYVYDINDLADLKGKKYHRKKNHYNRFKKNYPNYEVESLDENNVEAVRRMVEDWYKDKPEEDADDFEREKVALTKALSDYKALGMDGLVLLVDGNVVAITMGSKISHNTMDVHFEKARGDVEGAYTAINCEFAQYIRSKYPEILFLDREEDMGIEGLRKAKESYYPHHMVAKCWATLKADCKEELLASSLGGCKESVVNMKEAQHED